MFYLIGSGIYDENDISLRAVEKLKKCDKIYFESYTNTSNINIRKLSNIVGKEIVELNREQTESGEFLNEAKSKEIALIVPGDPLNATTHISLIIQCKEQKIEHQIIHASGILSAVAESGLSSYRFGETTTIPWPRKDYNPKSFVNIIEKNSKSNLHTLLLLDTQPQMSIQQAMEIILSTKTKKITNKTKFIAISALGSEKPTIVYETTEKLLGMQFEAFPQSLIMPAKLNHIEEEMVNLL